MLTQPSVGTDTLGPKNDGAFTYSTTALQTGNTTFTYQVKEETSGGTVVATSLPSKRRRSNFVLPPTWCTTFLRRPRARGP